MVVAVYNERTRIPIMLTTFYGVANIVLNSLNVFWLSKMCSMVYRHVMGTERKAKFAKNHALQHKNGHIQVESDTSSPNLQKKKKKT